MKTKECINEALAIMEGHDWFWFMADYGYLQYHDSAKATMREFVKVVNSIEDAEVRKALRSLWMLTYMHSHDEVNGRKTENYEGRKAELMKTITLAA